MISSNFILLYTISFWEMYFFFIHFLNIITPLEFGWKVLNYKRTLEHVQRVCIETSIDLTLLEKKIIMNFPFATAIVATLQVCNISTLLPPQVIVLPPQLTGCTITGLNESAAVVSLSIGRNYTVLMVDHVTCPPFH